MATITRCDECKRLSDEQEIGPIGKRWKAIKYKDTLANIHIRKDLCVGCLKKMILDSPLITDDGEE